MKSLGKLHNMLSFETDDQKDGVGSFFLPLFPVDHLSGDNFSVFYVHEM